MLNEQSEKESRTSNFIQEHTLPPLLYLIYNFKAFFDIAWLISLSGAMDSACKENDWDTNTFVILSLYPLFIYAKSLTC